MAIVAGMDIFTFILMQNHKKEKNFFVFFTKKTDRIPVKGPACLIFWLFCNDFFCFFVEEVHIVAGNFEGHLLSGEIFSAFRLCQEFILTDTEADIRRIIDLLASDEFPCDLTVLSVLCRSDFIRADTCKDLLAHIAELSEEISFFL